MQKITLLSSLALLCSLQALPVHAEPQAAAPVASVAPEAEPTATPAAAEPESASSAPAPSPSAEASAAAPAPSPSSALPAPGELPLQLRFEDHQKPDETGRIRTKDSHLLVGGLTRPGAEIKIGDKLIAANEEGQFQVRVPLQDGMQTIVVTATHENGDQATRSLEVECKLPPDWFMVAIGDLEAGAFNLGGNLQAIAQNDNFPPGLYVDGRVAYYLKGKILGKYLLTSAFDSARQFQPKALSAVDPNRFYPIYGDSSTLVRDAQASGKLYLRLEMLPPDDPKAARNFSNLLLGDYSAGLAGDTVNLGQYNRTFYGLRTLLETERKPKEKPLFSATLFAAPVRTIPVRDELRATGISSYRLSVTQTRYLPDASSPSNAPVGTNPDNPTQVNLNNPNQVRQPFVVEGTEQVSIIVRDKNQPDRIVSTRLLERGIDYNLDPFFGSLTLKQPIGTFDPNGNVNYVVVNYEYTNDPFYGVNPFQANSLQGLWSSLSSAFDDTLQRNAFGGRLETTLFDQTLTLGANYVQENKAPHNARLISADTRWLWNDRLRLSGEYAFSQVDVLAGLGGSLGADALNSLNGFVSNDGGNTWSAVSPALNGQQNIGHAFRLELDAQPFDWTTVRLFMRQTDPLFATLFGGGEPGVRRWGSNIEQQISEHFSLLGDFIQTDSLPRPVIPGVQDLGQLQFFGNNTLASVGVHWQSVPIERDQVLPNAPGGDISFRQQQSISNPLNQDKLRVGGGNPAMSQESAKKLAEKTLNAASTTETLPSDYDKAKDPAPEKPKENPLNNVGSMFADLRAELSRSDSGTNALQNARLRGSFNFVPFEKLLGNLRAALSNNQFSDTQNTARSRSEFSGELGLGATYALDKSISLFTRLDMFHIGSAIYQPTTTASIGLTGSMLETEDISLQPYAQYGINSAIDARNNMISLGLNNRWKITPWLTNNLMIEQSFNVNESFKGLPTQLANATSGSVGFEFLPTKEFKSSLKYELRRQVGAGGMAPTINPVTGQSNLNGAVPGGIGSVLLDPTLNPQLNPGLVGGVGNTPLPVQPLNEELWQQTGTLAMNGKVGDLSLFGLYLFNQFHTPEQLRSRDIHLRTGAAFRPIGNDVFNIVAMHEFRHVSQPNLFNLSLVEIPLELQADSQVFSLEGIWQILSNVEFSQKYAVKFSTSTVLDTSYRDPKDRSLDKTITNPEPVTTDLIISRLAYRPFYTFEFWDKFDVAGEFRIMRQWPDSIFNAKAGFLTELGYLVTQDVRLGVGYNFTGFDDVNANSNNYQAGNWFVRVTGKY